MKLWKRSSGGLEEFDHLFCKLPFQTRPSEFQLSVLPSEFQQIMLDQPLAGAKEFWLLVDSTDGQPLGRIGANVSPYLLGLGYVGFFEMHPQSVHAEKLAHQLLQEACTWLRARGCTKVVGPVDYSTWFSYRFLDMARSPFLREKFFPWEPLNPPEYPAWFRSFGMKQVHAYHSLGFTRPEKASRLETPGGDNFPLMIKQAKDKGFRFRPLNLKSLDQGELPILHSISHSAFQGSFLFEPLALSDFRQLYAAAMKRYDFSPSCLVEDPNGDAVGFHFVFRDSDTLVLKTMAVLPEYQKLKLSTALLAYTFSQIDLLQIQTFVSALVKTGADSEYHERRHQKAGAKFWRHDYSIFAMDYR